MVWCSPGKPINLFSLFISWLLGFMYTLDLSYIDICIFIGFFLVQHIVFSYVVIVWCNCYEEVSLPWQFLFRKTFYWGWHTVKDLIHCHHRKKLGGTQAYMALERYLKALHPYHRENEDSEKLGLASALEISKLTSSDIFSPKMSPLLQQWHSS